MQINEFIEVTGRIEKYYDKEYTKDQMTIMFDELGSLKIERYRQIVSAVIKKCKFLPKLADLVEANKEEPYTSNRDEQSKVECEKCNSTGYIIYTKAIKDGDREYKNQYASVCSCGNAKKYEGWNVSDKRYRSNYYTPTAQELGV